MKKTLLPFFGLFAAVCMVNADVLVQGDASELTLSNADYEARFVKENSRTGESLAWALTSLKYKGNDIVIDARPNGAAMRNRGDESLPGGGYIGAAHGGEEIRRIVVRVDGKEHSPEEPLSVSGKQVELLKESALGPYEYLSRITLNDSGLREEATFKAVKDASNVEILYPFAHCLSKAFMEWATGSEEGMTASGEFLDDESFTNLGRLKWVAAFCKEGNYGTLVSYAENYEGSGDITHRFLNHEKFSKLYFWPNVPQTGETKFICRITCFDAEADTWIQAAEDAEKR